MRTVVTYLDKNNKQVNKDEAWTVVTKVYNDAGNLQRTGYSVGEAQKRANSAPAAQLHLTETDTGKEHSFSKNIVKAGRDEGCDLVIAIPEKKKIEKIHAMFELNKNEWYITDMSKGKTSVNGVKLPGNIPQLLKEGDIIDFAGKKQYKF